MNKSREFLGQIKEDIINIQNDFSEFDNKLVNDWYAFNYWVLKFLYHIDIEDVKDYIIEYKNGQCDCFIWYSDTRELFILRNLYLLENTINTHNINDFLSDNTLDIIFNNNYVCSDKIKELSCEFENTKDYTVYLYYYITRPMNTISKEIIDYFDSYRKNTSYKFGVIARLMSLDEINQQYTGELLDKNSFEYDFILLGKHLIEMKSEENNKENNVNTAYFAISTYDIYNMFCKSEECKYDLFDENIREYLGTKGKYGKTNKIIKQTLLDDVERNRFFYYNNGITIICQKLQIEKYGSSKKRVHIECPKVVNGCQSVNTIVDAFKENLLHNSISQIAKDFKHSKVLVKIFEVDKNNDSEKKIYQNIVKYTNSQTAISLKDFVSRDAYFLNIQTKFLEYGFYLIVKQSDIHKFESNNALFLTNTVVASPRYKLLLKKNISKPKDLFIPLDKLLRVLMAFYFDGYEAFNYSASLLKEGSVKYYINFSKRITDFFDIENMINLYLIFLKSGGNIVGRKERYPVPYHILDFMGRYIKNDENGNYNYDKVKNKLDIAFLCSESINEIFDAFCQIDEDYGEKFMDIYKADYPTMTKHRKIDEQIINDIMKEKKKEATRYSLLYFLQYIE